jgi:hypothetical protein
MSQFRSAENSHVYIRQGMEITYVRRAPSDSNKVKCMMKGFLPAAAVLFALLAGCGAADDLGPNAPPVQPPGPPPTPDIALGQTAFVQECARCHNSGDGFDLAYFSYPDSTIIRRALGHVNLTTSQQIAAYIGWLNTPHVSRHARVFQPKGTPAASDVEFAVGLFGQDAWPAMTTAQLRAINPADVRVPLALPEWSVEGENTDWLADAPPPPGIMSYNGNRAANAVAAYQAAPSAANLALAVEALSDADHSPANPAAPCLFNDASRVNYLSCYEVRRWTSSLVAQHMLRQNSLQSAGTLAHEVWWAVGEAARQAIKVGSGAIPNAASNMVDWFYLGWMFEPGVHESFYLENRLGPRLAVFVALRGQVSRPPNSWGEHRSIYDDLIRAAEHTPNSWANAVGTFALTHILERLNSGERPTTTAQKNTATTLINTAITRLSTKVSAAQLSALQALATQAKSKL